MHFDRIEHYFGTTDWDETLRLFRFEGMYDIVMPKSWSDAACAAFINDCFHKDALPPRMMPVRDADLPQWLWRQAPDHAAAARLSPDDPMRYRCENDIRLVLHRVAGALTHAGWKAGYFNDEACAIHFYRGLTTLHLTQIASLEPALLATIGLDWAYGVECPPPAPRAAVPLDVLMDVAGALKPAVSRRQMKADISGITAPITCSVHHPDVLDFVGCRLAFEADAVARVMGRRLLQHHTHAIMDACGRETAAGFDPLQNRALGRAVTDARQDGITEGAISSAVLRAMQGHESEPLTLKRKDEDAPDSFALKPCLQMTDAAMESVVTGHGIDLVDPGSDDIVARLSATRLMDHLTEAVSVSGAPMLAFSNAARAFSPYGADTALATDVSGAVMGRPGWSVPAATLNLGRTETHERMRAAVRILITALDIVHTMRAGDETQTPSLAARPVALRHAGLSAVLMRRGVAYDSDDGRSIAADVSAAVTAAALETSLDIARDLGAAPDAIASQQARTRMMATMRHRYHALIGQAATFREWLIRPFTPYHLKTQIAAWHHDAVRGFERALDRMKTQMPRNMYLTDLPADDDMAMRLDCDCAGIAPVRALCAFEALRSDDDHPSVNAGGDPVYGKRMSQDAVTGLRKLGYTAAEIDDIFAYVVGHGTLLDAPSINHETLKHKGLCKAAITAVEHALKNTLHIRTAFSRWIIGTDVVAALGIDADAGDDILGALGFTEDDIDAANLYCCGVMTIEGAPHLKPEHYAVFDCAVRTGDATRNVTPLARMQMMAAVSPYISGCAAMPVEMNAYVNDDDIRDVIMKGWQMGLKTLDIYRAGSSLLNPVAILPQTRRMATSAALAPAVTSAGLATRKITHAAKSTPQDPRQSRLFDTQKH